MKKTLRDFSVLANYSDNSNIFNPNDYLENDEILISQGSSSKNYSKALDSAVKNAKTLGFDFSKVLHKIKTNRKFIGEIIAPKNMIYHIAIHAEKNEIIG